MNARVHTAVRNGLVAGIAALLLAGCSDVPTGSGGLEPGEPQLERLLARAGCVQGADCGLGGFLEQAGLAIDMPKRPPARADRTSRWSNARRRSGDAPRRVAVHTMARGSSEFLY